MSLNLDRNHSHQRMLLALLSREGLPEGERSDVWVIGLAAAATPEDSERRNRLWAIESALYAFREMALCERCDWRVVVRAWGQVRTYIPQCPKTLPSVVRDAAIEIQNAIEDRIQPRD